MEETTKVMFLGTPEFAADVLKTLLPEIRVSGVITQPDRPKSRNGKSEPSPVKILAQKNNIVVHQPESKNELTELVRQESPTLLVVAAFGMILPEELLKIPVFGTLNVHPSLLPEYRGPSPIEATILNGDLRTGVTIMELNEKMDEGNIVAQKEITLNGRETAPELKKFAAKIGGVMLTEVIPKWLNHELTSVPQGEKATYCGLIKKEDGKVNFAFETAEKIERKSRAYQPWPGVFAFWEDKKVDFFEIETSDEKVRPGEVTVKGKKIIIGTPVGSFAPGKLKLEGKKMLTPEEFLRGYPTIAGSKLE